MKGLERRLIVALLTLVALGLRAPAADAQTRVRVTRDETTVWRAGFIVPATVVQKGAVLEVAGRQDTWYEVVLPSSVGNGRTTGFIVVNRVESVDSQPLPGTSPQQGTQPQTRTRPSSPVRPSLRPRGVRGFANAGYGRFTAHESFEAVLGQPGGLWYGGGGEFRNGPWFVEGAAEWFRHTGERAFIFNGDVIKLGIPDTITVIPAMATGGYRRQYTPAVSVSGGGGVGRYWYKEESMVAGTSEDFDLQATGYHVRAAVEWHKRGLLATAFEFQYTWVPDALTGGLAASVDEHDLGGMQVRLKILLGR